MNFEYFNEPRITGRKIGGKSFFAVETNDRHIQYDYKYPFHYHNWCELYYLKSGKCAYLIDDVKYELKAGSLVFACPGTKHKVCYGKENYERMLMYFTKDYISTSLISYLESISDSPVCFLEVEQRQEIESAFMIAINNFSNPDKFSDKVYENVIYQLMLHFIRREDKDKSELKEKTYMLIAHTIRYIENNYADKITLENLADINNVSRSHLSRKFKEATGINIRDYITQIRIDKAKKMLVETNDSISKISELCGFADSNYFSHVFTKKENISPLKYRKIYIGK